MVVPLDEFSFQVNNSFGGVKGFPGCEGKMKTLEAEICRYEKADVARAIYCLNSWGRNRSCQETALALNGLLIEKTFGSERIESYSQFSAFCKKVIDLCPVTYADDYTIPVFGDEHVLYDGNYYAVYLGCGAEHEYFMSVFLPALSSVSGLTALTISVLSYMDGVVGCLGGANWHGLTYEKELTVPSASYWSAVCAFFDSVEDYLPASKIIDIFSGTGSSIERSHFLIAENLILPLFNASFLMDYVDYALSTINEQEAIGVADIGIGSLCLSMFSPKGSLEPRSIANPLLLIDGKPKPFGVSSLISSKQGLMVLVGVDSSRPSAVELIEEIKHSLVQGATVVSGIAETSGKRRALTIRSCYPLLFVIYDSSISPNSPRMILVDGSEAFCRCTALDAACIISLADSPEELFDYFTYELSCRKNQRFMSMDGLAGSYLNWKLSNGVLIKGTEDKASEVNLFTPNGEVDAEVFEVFQSHYSRISSNALARAIGYPFKWNTGAEERGFVRISDKGLSGLEYMVYRFRGPATVLIGFSYANVMSMDWQRVDSEDNQRRLVEDSLMLAMRELEESFEKLIDGLGGLLICMYVYYDVSAEMKSLVEASKYGIAAKVVSTEPFVVEVAANQDVFLNELAKASDRTVEIAVSESVLTAISLETGLCYDEFFAEFKKMSAGKKKVDTAAIELPYHVIPSRTISVPAPIRDAVRKEIAFACDDAGIQPGYYQGKSANKVARNIQLAMSSLLDERLRNFDMLSVHLLACSACAGFQHNNYLNRQRAGSFESIDEEELEFVRKRAISEREDSRKGILAMRYLIESNLVFNERKEATRKCTSKDFAYLHEFCRCLTEFLSNADMFFGEPATLTLVVEDNFLTDVEEDERLYELSLDMKRRQIDESARALPGEGVDASFAEKVVSAFEVDTGFSLGLALDVCDFLSCITPENNIGEVAADCVIAVRENELISALTELEGDRHTIEEIQKAIDFFCLDPATIKIDNGKKVEYVPFGRSKNRPNRYELRPMVRMNGKLLYSPVSVAFAGKRWRDGMAQRFLPCKQNFENTYEATRQWKAEYEKNLEYEVEASFLSKGIDRCNVFRGLHLHKKGEHPLDLGDYDGLAYDQTADIVWVVECKEIEKTETAYDYMSYQKRYFGSAGKEDGVLAKFERRVEYLTKNLNLVMADLGLGTTGKTSLRPVVVMNKPFMDISLRFPYEILALWEFREELGLPPTRSQTED